jgi:3-oxoacyl-[acyl-carrier-protein] synthase II
VSGASLSHAASTDAVAVTGCAVYLPDVDLSAVLGAPAIASTPSPRDVRSVLGRKKLLYKEPATRFALAAVNRALRREDGGPRPDYPVDPRTAVVVSSNLGNLATVHEVAQTVRAGSDRDVSPLAAPNTSSNIVATTVAIWYRFGGPNLMVCAGATGGLDALMVAIRLLRAKRADRVVVVGVEPDDDVATAVHRMRSGVATGRPLRAGAACVILEAAHRCGTGDRRAMALVDLPAVWRPADADKAAPVMSARGVAADLFVGPRTLAPAGMAHLDLVECLGDAYGALGVLQVAVSTLLLDGGFFGPMHLMCGDPRDGWRCATVTPPNPV